MKFLADVISKRCIVPIVYFHCNWFYSWFCPVHYKFLKENKIICFLRKNINLIEIMGYRIDHKKTWSFCLGLLKCLLPKLFPLEYLHLEFSDHVVRKPKQFLEWPYMVKNQNLQLIVWLSINRSTILPSMGGEVLEVDQIASVKLPWLLPQRTLISTAQLVDNWEKDMIVILSF